jgi:hypothetical protein
MRAYTVHAPPGDDAPDRYALIKDGFSWPALFFAVPWMLWHRMWLTLMGYVIAWLLIAWTMRLANNDVGTVIAVLGAVFFAMEANNFRRWSLAGRGWRELGSAYGDTWKRRRSDSSAPGGVRRQAARSSARRREPRNAAIQAGPTTPAAPTMTARSSGSFPSRSGDGRHHRLRLREFALRRKRLRARRAGHWRGGSGHLRSRSRPPR